MYNVRKAMIKRGFKSKKEEALEGMKKMKNKGSWAETHGQKEGEQLRGTITGRKFGPKHY